MPRLLVINVSIENHPEIPFEWIKRSIGAPCPAGLFDLMEADAAGAESSAETPRSGSLINPVSMTPEEFTRQHGPHPGHVVTWHAKRVPPPERPPLTLWQKFLPWTRPKLTDGEKWARKQLD